MYRSYYIAADALTAAVIIFPIFVIFSAVHGNRRRMIKAFVFALYLASVYSAVGGPTITYIKINMSINLLPLYGMIADYKNAMLNVLLFVPMGMILPLLSSDFKNRKSVAKVAASVSVVLELLQLFTFRTTDINDIITNTIGAVIGCCVVMAIIKDKSLNIENITSEEICFVFFTVFTVMFLIQPLVLKLI